MRIFCDSSCRQSYREDRAAGLIYGPRAIGYTGDGSVVLASSWTFGAVVDGECPYCGSATVTRTSPKREAMRARAIAAARHTIPAELVGGGA